MVLERGEPWIYPYVDFGETGRPGRTILRPAVEVVFIGPWGETPRVWALVDSGSENCLAGPWVPQTIGVTPDPATQIDIGVGGRSRPVRFADVTIRLLPPPETGFEPVEWGAEVGFLQQWEPPWALLGQRGFLDRFCVSMHWSAQALAVEHWEAFDNRYGTREPQA